MPLEFPLRSARLDLRPVEEADLDALLQVYGDPEVMRHVGEGRPVDRAGAAAMIAAYRAHQHEHGYAFWAVIERGTGELIGDAGLERTEHGVELGYTLARSRWGRGLATEAGRLCVEAADGPLSLPHLVALADLANPASARVLAHLGFVADDVVEAYGRPHRHFTRAR
ncbi:GNAT family N-acetyltransferase [Brachybacterium saurashtrense]|uniref:N-acetyltransferase n=1 Tax=Brachybacterium saurashtrense TaxID=556288 RepID=A0A345YQR3_9MICO|nr:GNAT family N-acetyltransferase [Brachybacterium saurashtrense]AXK46265.1 N-acetyltransferase [Brachybacterium saurashtrense]RRR24005.1 N-acetyltransferase [Brachybacterium saurashtrense]